jgi:uncharacterized membrane protein
MLNNDRVANRRETASELAKGLGRFSLALGTPQVIVPGMVNRLIGVRNDGRSKFWQRVVGVRELAAAWGILGQKRPAEWLCARVAGDVMDLTLLGAAFVTRRNRPGRLAVATAQVTGVLALDAYGAYELGKDPQASGEEQMTRKKTAITIRLPREEVYDRWKQAVQNPPDGVIELRLMVIGEDPGRRVDFRTPNGAKQEVTGVATFTEAVGNRGTEIHLDMGYETPAGPVGEAVEKLTGNDPLQLAKDDLRRLRQVMEVGEVVRSDATPDGHAGGLHLHQRPAQPPVEYVQA